MFYLIAVAAVVVIYFTLISPTKWGDKISSKFKRYLSFRDLSFKIPLKGDKIYTLCYIAISICLILLPPFFECWQVLARIGGVCVVLCVIHAIFGKSKSNMHEMHRTFFFVCKVSVFLMLVVGLFALIFLSDGVGVILGKLTLGCLLSAILAFSWTGITSPDECENCALKDVCGFF